MKKEYTLIIDVGNSTTIFGVFENEKFVERAITNTFEEHKKPIKIALRELLKKLSKSNYVFTGAMIFSVVPSYNSDVKSLAKKYFKIKPKVFDWKKYNFQEKDTRITDSIGADLLADIVAAKKSYSCPAMIVDLGTVNKMLLLDKKGKFIGSSFTPGMQGSLNMFKSQTALLPKLTGMDSVKLDVGTSTESSMKHGVYWSTVAYIIHQHELQEKNLKSPIFLVLTGGNSSIIKDEIPDKIYDPILTLKGMNYLYLEAKK